MAALATTDVTIHDSWFTDGLGGVKHVARRVTMTLSSHGNATTANSIPAAALSMSEVVDASPFVKDDNTEILTISPNASGSLLLVSAANGTIATATGDYVGVVVGLPTV